MPYREGRWQWVARAPYPAGAKANHPNGAKEKNPPPTGADKRARRLREQYKITGAGGLTRDKPATAGPSLCEEPSGRRPAPGA